MITMRRVERFADLSEPGDFVWTVDEHGTRKLHLVVPSPTEGIARTSLPISAEGWEWTGSDAAPTLSPSVDVIGHWHGWVSDGVLVEV